MPSSRLLHSTLLLLAATGSAQADSGVRQQTEYDYYYDGILARQDSLLSNVSAPMLITAFLAAFIASLIGPSLAATVESYLGMEFQLPNIGRSSGGPTETALRHLAAAQRLYTQ